MPAGEKRPEAGQVPRNPYLSSRSLSSCSCDRAASNWCSVTKLFISSKIIVISV